MHQPGMPVNTRLLSRIDSGNPFYGCVCQPTMHSKHICTIYLQFALLRLDQEQQLWPQLVAEPPDAILSVVEQIEPLLWLGFAHNLYCRSALKLHLTMHCQVCGYSGDNAEDLSLHLLAAHPVHLQESLYLTEMFQWSMFMEMGCFCNPMPGWGTLHHECVGFDAAWPSLLHRFGWQVILPWPFTSHELMVLLADLLSLCCPSENFHGIDDTQFSFAVGGFGTPWYAGYQMPDLSGDRGLESHPGAFGSPSSGHC